MAVGTRNAVIMMMYCATWVHVTARMPPRNEHTRMPASPKKIPIVNSTPMKRAAIIPTP